MSSNEQNLTNSQSTQGADQKVSVPLQGSDPSLDGNQAAQAQGPSPIAEISSNDQNVTADQSIQCADQTVLP